MNHVYLSQFIKILDLSLLSSDWKSTISWQEPTEKKYISFLRDGVGCYRKRLLGMDYSKLNTLDNKQSIID